MQIGVGQFLVLVARGTGSARIGCGAVAARNVLGISQCQTQFTCAFGAGKQLRMAHPFFLNRTD